MKHVIDVTIDFTVDAQAGTDVRLLERELANFARRAIDAAMKAPAGKSVPLLDGRSIELTGTTELVEKTVSKLHVTTLGLQSLWRWARQLPQTQESSLLALLIASTLRERGDALAPDQLSLIEAADREIAKVARGKPS